MDSINILVILLAGAVLGGLIGWYVARNRYHRQTLFTEEEFLTLSTERNLLKQRVEDFQSEGERIRQEYHQLSSKITELSVERSKFETINQALQEKLNTQRSEMEELHKQMQEKFESIASKIVINNSRMIQQQHSDKLTDILNPLREKIEKFENTVNNTHKENIRENQSLKDQLKLLQELNQTIGKEAHNLTTALKGQVKTQGNWGEMILETILEKSGLMKDREYEIQTSLLTEDGRRLQPDVLVRLPENKTIIVDSKVSLVGYEKYNSAENPTDQETALREHIQSIRKHVRSLGEKEYHQVYELKSLDFVLMFIPVEPAFSLAIQHDPGLFNDAFEHNIVVVSPSTLLATLRTISSIWKLEYQNKNAQEIARQSGALYDKFTGFLTDFQKLGDTLASSQKAWDGAMNKLSTGRGNLVTSVEKLKTLGARASKSIPQNLIDDESYHGEDEHQE
jgi:DNA recombination protein RmuC